MANEAENNRRFKVELDEQACKACKYCLAACPRGVFVQADYFNEKGYRPVRVKAPDDCIGCKRCFFLCPDFAIDVEAATGEDANEKTV
ncbi:MAG TPA: 4Fe-4S dicluster domain-containing protein [Negativicutes bacterium]|nr:4Fe-4S dicluster domain-containing protein [Negativicutes bacterium]